MPNRDAGRAIKARPAPASMADSRLPLTLLPKIPLPGGRGGIILGIPFPRSPLPGPGGGGANPANLQRARMYLFELARRTGRRLYNGGSLLGVSQEFVQIAEELRRQYSLGYYQKHGGQAGQRRQIRVHVSQPNGARQLYLFTEEYRYAAGR